MALLAVLWYVAPGLIQLPGGFSAAELKGTPVPTPTFAPLTFSGNGDQATAVFEATGKLRFDWQNGDGVFVATLKHANGETAETIANVVYHPGTGSSVTNVPPGLYVIAVKAREPWSLTVTR